MSVVRRQLFFILQLGLSLLINARSRAPENNGQRTADDEQLSIILFDTFFNAFYHRCLAMRNKFKNFFGVSIFIRALIVFALVCIAVACESARDGLSVRPKTMRDVPAERLAFRFEADVAEENLPEYLRNATATADKLEAIQRDFEARRPTEELLRTVLSPDGQRALALYGTSETEGLDFRMDLYSADGVFLRNLMPREMIGVFRDTVAWSPDGQSFAFIAVRNPAVASATPDPGLETTAPPVDPTAQTGATPVDPLAPTPMPTVAPVFAPIQTFSTEQIYVSDRDGASMRPLTMRDGLIYFELSWSPEARAVAALACREDEWNARKDKGEMPGGRPRIITLDGQERLLDDRLADAPPAWSPDASKVATAFDKTIAIYDVGGAQPTGANISLEEPLWKSSLEYDAKIFKKDANSNAADGQTTGGGGQAPPVGSVVLNSFNPVVRLAWTEPEILFVQTAFVHFYSNEPVPTVRYVRWHGVRLSPQATLL